MGSYEPNGEVTGSLPAAPQPTWTWEGGTPVVVAPGETLETISRRHNVPVSAIMQANNITNPTAVHPGQHLVIPRQKTASPAQPPRAATPAAVMPPVGPIGAPKTALAPTSGVHVVAPGETLHSIARLYGKPVMVLAKANNIPPDTMVRVGERIVIPDVQPAQAQANLVPPRTQAPAAVPAAPAHGPDLASAESPHSARVASPEPAPASDQTSAVKTAEPAGALPSFRWPARGRVIAGFGPSPNGLQNDGINVAVPEGTPVKAAEDGVVAYAGNELKGYGNLVLVRHSNGFVTAYAHASEIMVKRGDARETRSGDREIRPDRQRHVTATALRDPQRFDAGRSVAVSQRRVDLHDLRPLSMRTPRRPAKSCTYCHATRPERAPRVVAHSSASRRSSALSNAHTKVRDVALDHRQIFVLAAA